MVDEALPQEKEFYLFDNHIKGLGCRILPTGTKSYYYRFTSPIDKKRKNIKIENAKLIKLEEVRNIVQKYKLDVFNFIDPRVSIQEQIKTQQFEERFQLLSEFSEKYNKKYIEIGQKIYELNILIHDLKLTIKNKGF